MKVESGDAGGGGEIGDNKRADRDAENFVELESRILRTSVLVLCITCTSQPYLGRWIRQEL